ncbi:PREDICTED: alpha-taxilin-like [Ipomoea nil]|uniref:alpha-taxilin-like n=1 Tax=Ipomoea nil TaxID=35883 RepID=UPI0009014C36|nr:PREDICTED: alpha-taxilin-like [Ipomoea nil]
MESENVAPNPAVNQLPEADSLPDGFVVSSSADALALKSPKLASEKSPAPELADYKEDTLLEPELRPGVIVNHVNFDATSESGCRDAPRESGVGGEGQGSSENSTRNQLAPTIKETPSQESSEHRKIEASEAKRKNAKRSFKSEKEFLEFTLKYQQVIAERDSAIAVRDRLESLCRELQRQNKVLMEECKRVSTEGQNLRLDISNKFRDAIKEVSNRMEEQKDECLSQLKENETLKSKLKQVTDQYAIAEQQYTQKLKQKDLELQIADLKIKQHEEKILQEESQMKLYAEQVSELLMTEKNLRLQLAADGEKFQQFQEALSKSNEVFEAFKQEIDKMSKSIKELKNENTFLKSKCEGTDIALIELAEEREQLKKQLEKMRNQKERLESLCRSLQAERKASSTAIASSDSV